MLSNKERRRRIERDLEALVEADVISSWSFDIYQRSRRKRLIYRVICKAQDYTLDTQSMEAFIIVAQSSYDTGRQDEANQKTYAL